MQIELLGVHILPIVLIEKSWVRGLFSGAAFLGSVLAFLLLWGEDPYIWETRPAVRYPTILAGSGMTVVLLAWGTWALRVRRTVLSGSHAGLVLAQPLRFGRQNTIRLSAAEAAELSLFIRVRRVVRLGLPRSEPVLILDGPNMSTIEVRLHAIEIEAGSEARFRKWQESVVMGSGRPR